ncbi:hypothetical protein [Acidovorax sp. SDU_ACID1]|uniref:hypothetical protein n=1 Tax=Acidovorax sp. SDU_ACID1 TaxID=3136632 RepID=UPI003873A331
MADTFVEVIDAIFAKMAVRYGAAWLRQWDGLDMNTVKSDWGSELSGFSRNLEPLRYALRNLPERCPNVGQFRAIANACPLPEFKQLPVPKADERVVAEEIAKQTKLREAVAPAADGKAWARSLVARAEAGERIRPITLRFAREAIGMEGRQVWQ